MLARLQQRPEFDNIRVRGGIRQRRERLARAENADVYLVWSGLVRAFIEMIIGTNANMYGSPLHLKEDSPF